MHSAGGPRTISRTFQRLAYVGLILCLAAEQKQQACALFHQHLLVEALRLQRGSALQQQLLQSGSIRNRLLQHPAAHRVRRPSCCIQNNQPLLTKHRRDPLRKRAGEGTLRAITSAQQLDLRTRIKQPCRLLQSRRHARAQTQTAYRRAAFPPAMLAQTNPHHATIRGLQVHMVNLVEVVVFARQPEDRHMRRSGRLRRLTRQPDGGCCLVERV